MFNQFARAARLAVLDAVREAGNRSPQVTDEHLLLALLNQQDTTSSSLLRTAGVTADKVDAAFRTAERKAGLSDAEAATLLSELGIDLDEVVTHVERSLGENALSSADVTQPRRDRPPFAAVAKDILRGALDQARSMRHKELRDEHLLLALAAHEGVAGQLLAAHDLGYLDIRARLAKAG